MRRRAFLLGCGCLSLAAAGRFSAAADPYVAPPRFARPDPASEEGGLWGFMDREEQRLRRSSFLIRDPALNKYVNAIACRLADGHCPDMRVYLVRTPFFNASMAPNGMMQVWSGLLLRVTSEAQLAAVIGHEIGHYLARHSLERLRDAKSRSAFGQVLGIALSAAGAGSANSLAQLALIAGGLAYSREHEREADRIGIDLMASAGYAPTEASLVWGQLLEELRAGKEGEDYWNQSVLFATHPPAEERQKSLAEAARARSAEGAHVGADTYRSMLAAHRGAFLYDEIRRRSFAETMVLLERLQRAAQRDGEIRFFKGEAYRVRAQENDLQSALQEYRAAQTLEAPPPELHRSMGLVLRQLGQGDEAARAFGRYLELKPDAEDAELIRTYLPRREQ